MSCPASSSSLSLCPASTGFLPATIRPHGARGCLTPRVSGQVSKAWWPITHSGAASPSRRLATTPWLRLAYMGVFSLVALEFITGLVLFSVVEGGPVLHFFVGWIPRLINIQWIRFVHFLVMFIFVGFLIHHVYSAVLVGSAEKNGEMESIFTGWKFVPQRLIDEDGCRNDGSCAAQAAGERQAMSEAAPFRIGLLGLGNLMRTDDAVGMLTLRKPDGRRPLAA